MQHLIQFTITLLLLAVLQGCGQKGDLIVEDEQPPANQQMRASDTYTNDDNFDKSESTAEEPVESESSEGTAETAPDAD